MTDIPPSVVAASDQGFAQANQDLDEFLTVLAKAIKDNSRQSDAVPWAASVEYVLYRIETDEDGEYTRRVIETLHAAAYQLARQKMARES